MNIPVVDISFTITGRVKLDIDRAFEDPWWDQVTQGLDLNDPIQFQQAVSNYISAYLRHENLLSEVPWSCGPADIYSVKVEVNNGGSNNAADERNV